MIIIIIIIIIIINKMNLSVNGEKINNKVILTVIIILMKMIMSFMRILKLVSYCKTLYELKTLW